ncbi:HU family DNA-binding protein [Lysobacter humi (ex Lee et al. 2017)]
MHHMNKGQLVDAIAQRSELTKAQAEAALSATLESITDALKRGEAVTLVGFGTFEARNRAGRQGRNPKTGETIEIPASINATFKAGKALKDSLK